MTARLLALCAFIFLFWLIVAHEPKPSTLEAAAIRTIQEHTR